MAIENKARYQRGLDTMKAIGYDPTPGGQRLGDVFWDFTIENCFGNVWGRPGLSLRDRQLVTLGVLIAADNDGIMPHFHHAAHLGFTEPEMREIIFQALTYAGWPRGSAVTKRFNAFLASPENNYGKPAAKAAAKPRTAAAAKSKTPAKAAAKAAAKPKAAGKKK